MEEYDEFAGLGNPLAVSDPPFTPGQVILRYRRVRARDKMRMVITGLALMGALLAFLFLNFNEGFGPGLLDPVRVRAATPYPTLTVTPVFASTPAP